MSNIRAVLDKLIVLQKGLVITGPVTEHIKRAYKYPPNRSIALPDTPCWMNTWTLTAYHRYPGSLHRFYTISNQLFINDADLDRAADIASAFHEAYTDALDQDITLGGVIERQDVRGGDPTLVLLEWAGIAYIGLQIFLDIELIEAKTFSGVET